MALHRDCDFKLAKLAGLAVDRFPETNEEVKRVEELLSRELEKLSIDEHEKIVFEVHGIVPQEDEDDCIVERKLKELEEELDLIERKGAYNLAVRLNPSYVHSRHFRLMFLRCQRFETTSAASMIVRHFEEKRRLFGDGEVLAREVRQSDLSSEDHVLLQSGFAQVLPSRDAAGRSILVLSSGGIHELPKEGWDEKSEFRTTWYLSMSMLRDEESQKNGVIWLIMNFDGYKVSVENFKNFNKIETAIPTRVMGGHFCYTDPALRPYVAGFQIFISEHDRYRLRTHFGTREEIDFALHTFGIPAHDCPVGLDGSFSNTAHRQWLDMLRAQEEKESTLNSENFVAIPRRFDVLFGKSGVARQHTGTLRALHVVEMHFESYEKMGKYQKTDIADKIISIIHESGGRFLKQNDSGAWIEVQDVEARKKIAHWFRHARTRKQKELQQSTKTLRCSISDESNENVDSDAVEAEYQRSPKKMVRMPSFMNEHPILSIEDANDGV